MMEFNRLLIFLCSGAAKAGNKKLSVRLASQLVELGIADLGTLQDLSAQHSNPRHLQKRMIFINDCRSGCVNVLTHGFDKDKFIFFDVSPFLGSQEFDIANYISTSMLPRLKEKWMM